MTWHAAFQCLNCAHSWQEPAPADTWKMVREVAALASCPLCSARMDEGRVELLSHDETKIAILCSASYIFTLLP